MNRAVLATAIAVALAALLSAGCGGGKADNAAQARAGATLFAANCASCHGPNGTGGTGPTLNAKELLGVASEAQLFNTVSAGISGTRMPSWGKEFGGPMEEKQIRQIVAYLRSLAPTAPSVPNWRQGSPGPSSTSTSTTTP